MTRAKLSAVAATFVRLAGGMVSFMIQARFLGPHQFGVVGSALTIAALASLVSDYGLHSYVLQKGGAHPERQVDLLTTSLVLKTSITILVLPFCLAWVYLSDFSGREEAAAIISIFGFFLAAIADIAFLGWRVRSRFDREAALVTFTTALSLAIVVPVTVVTRDLLATAVAYSVGRALYLGAALYQTRHLMALGDLVPWTRIKERLRILYEARRYAVDQILTCGIGQIDIVLVGFFVDTATVGRYVAVTRIIQNGLPIVGMLAAVYVAPLARYHKDNDPAAFARLSRNMDYEFFVLALAAGIGAVMLGPTLVRLLFGSAYDATRELWPGFGFYVMVSILQAACGTQLVAVGLIQRRVMTLLLVLAIIVVGLAVFVPMYGIWAAPWVLAGANLVGLISFSQAIASKVGPKARIRARYLGFTLVILVAIIALIR